jgi:hypothetical protein
MRSGFDPKKCGVKPKEQVKTEIIITKATFGKHDVTSKVKSMYEKGVNKIPAHNKAF